MEASSQSERPSVANAVLEFATAVAALQAAGQDVTPAVTQARAIALQMPLNDYIALEKNCNAQLGPMYQHLRKYGAKLEDSIIVMQIGTSKVGVTVPADKNRNITAHRPTDAHAESTRVRYEVTVITSKISGSTSAVFDGQSKVARFIAALARDADAVSK